MQSDNEHKKEVIKNYMENRVRPVFDQLITALLLALPDNVITWSANWLTNYNYQINGNYNPNNNANYSGFYNGNHNGNYYNNQHDDTLDYQRYRQNQASSRQVFDQDDTVDYSRRNRRVSIDSSAERRKRSAQKKTESDKDSSSPEKKGRRQPTVMQPKMKIKFIQKTPEQIRRIKELLANSMLFQALDQQDQKIVIGAMEVKTYKPGEWLVQQGSGAVELYLIDSGEMDCFKLLHVGEKPKYVKTYKAGESFGELAHLYQAKNYVVCFALDRETFNRIVKDSVSKKRGNYQDTIDNCSLFEEMDDHQRMKICEIVKEQDVIQGTAILKQNEPSNKIYLVSEGRLEATRANRKITEYNQGEYFGELPMFNKSRIQATVTAKVSFLLFYFD